jgi:hypothetical protein
VKRSKFKKEITMAIRLTEARLRQIIREEARKLVEMEDVGPSGYFDDVAVAAAQEALSMLEADMSGPFNPEGVAAGVWAITWNSGVTVGAVKGRDISKDIGAGRLEVFLDGLSEATGYESGQFFSADGLSPATLKRAQQVGMAWLRWCADHDDELNSIEY